MVDIKVPVGVNTSSSTTTSPSSLMFLKDVSALIYLPKTATQECTVTKIFAQSIAQWKRIYFTRWQNLFLLKQLRGTASTWTAQILGPSVPSSPVDLSRSGARCVDHKVFNSVFFVDRPHHQTQILLTIIFNTLFKEESATVEVSAEFLKDSIRYTYLPTYIHAVSWVEAPFFTFSYAGTWPSSLWPPKRALGCRDWNKFFRHTTISLTR